MRENKRKKHPDSTCIPEELLNQNEEERFCLEFIDTYIGKYLTIKQINCVLQHLILKKN